MALCHEFGVRICNDECVVAMVAGTTSCYCAHCGAVCEGQFGGCPAVWSSGRNGEGVEVEIRALGPTPGATCHHANGTGHGEAALAPGTTVVEASVETLSARRAGGTGLQRAPITPARSAARPGEDDVLRLVADRLAAVETTLRGLDRRLASVESALSGGDAVEPGAWAVQLRQEVQGLRVALTRLIG